MNYIKTIDFIFTVKNDNYHLDTIERINKSLDYNLKALEICGLLNFVNFIIVDVSECDKVSTLISLDSKYKKNVQFIELKLGHKSDEEFNVAKCLNIGFKYGTSDYVLFSSNDIFLGIKSWANIYNFLSKNNKDINYFTRRIFIPLEFYDKNPTFDELDDYINSAFLEIGELSKTYGGAGIIGGSRAIIESISGFNEQMTGYGGADLELIWEASMKSLPIDLSVSHGVFSYKIPYSNVGTRSNAIRKLHDYSKIGFRGKVWGNDSSFSPKISNEFVTIFPKIYKKNPPKLKLIDAYNLCKISFLFFNQLKYKDLLSIICIYSIAKSKKYYNICFYGSNPVYLPIFAALGDRTLTLISEIVDGNRQQIFDIKMHLDRDFKYLHKKYHFFGLSISFYNNNIFNNNYILKKITESETYFVFENNKQYLNFVNKISEHKIKINNSSYILNNSNLNNFTSKFDLNTLILFLILQCLQFLKLFLPKSAQNIFKFFHNKKLS